MAKMIERVEVESKVLQWAISSSGWKIPELSKKLRISEKTITGWIGGEENPKINQLERLAEAIKRPLAAFFLAIPPEEKPLPKDYRMIPKREGKFDKKTILAIRRARRLQRISRELSENINSAIESKIPHVDISKNSKEEAKKIRGEFNLDFETQRKWKRPHIAFAELRDIIEARNILVFQFSMPLQDARGFALVDENPAVLVVNSKDQIEARIFTLMHEFGHALLKKSGIGMSEVSLFNRKIDRVESWCNEFASTFLLPENFAKEIFAENKSALTETKTLNKLSRQYKLSKAMLLYNMKKLNFISNEEYISILNRPYSEIEKKGAEKKKGFAILTSDQRCLNEKGQKFVSLVVNNVERGFITRTDALGYLSIKSKNLDKVTSRSKQ